MAETPDYFTPFIGWRAWGIEATSDGLFLVSHGGTTWPRHKPLVAGCHRKHHAPDPACSCGVYALADEEWPYYQYDRDLSGFDYCVFGTVALYGVVVRGTIGYRAERALPTALYVAHKDYRLVCPLREGYAVPVRIVNPFTFKTSDA